MKAIIVDDEKKGRDILHTLVSEYCTGVEITGTAADVEEGFRLISEAQPDLVFLDVEMPRGNGFALLERFPVIQFQVIFTTAYENYALQAIKVQALDYLLKPIDIDELKEAVEKARKKAGIPVAGNGAPMQRIIEYESRIGLPIKDGLVYVQLSDIIRIESDGSYSIFHTADNHQYLATRNIGEYEGILPGQFFFRVHKCHLVNMRKVKKFLRTEGYFAEMEDGSAVEISRRRKDEFLQFMAALG